VTGYLRIGGALILGVLIVLVAFAVAKRADNGTATEGKLEIAPGRSYIETSDADGDGVPDWEEGFNDRIFAAIATPTSTATTTYTGPSTFTGKFAEAFFEDYMQGKMNGADLTDPTKLVTGAVQAVEANTKSRTYSPSEIVVTADSEDALRAYGNLIGEILITYSTPNNENEGIILQRALEKNDPAELAPLTPILATYTDYIRYTLAVPVPASLAKEHLTLIDAYEAIRTDIEAMQVAFTDPLYSLARVKRYQDDASGLYYALQSIAAALTDADIFYAKDEPGSVLYLWST
jgi:hypothetical protein